MTTWGPPSIEVPSVRYAWTVRRVVEYGLFAVALVVQLTAIHLRSIGSDFIHVVFTNFPAVTALSLWVCGVFVRYRGWDPRKSNWRNHTYLPLELTRGRHRAGLLVFIVGRDADSGFTQTAVLYPGILASTLGWGWSHNSRMAPRRSFVEATETARGIFWGWLGIAILTWIAGISDRIGGQRYEMPERPVT